MGKEGDLMKLNQYTEATSLSDSDIFPIMQSGVLKKGTIQNLKSSLGGGLELCYPDTSNIELLDSSGNPTYLNGYILPNSMGTKILKASYDSEHGKFVNGLSLGVDKNLEILNVTRYNESGSSSVNSCLVALDPDTKEILSEQPGDYGDKILIFPILNFGNKKTGALNGEMEPMGLNKFSLTYAYINNTNYTFAFKKFPKFVYLVSNEIADT